MEPHQPADVMSRLHPIRPGGRAYRAAGLPGEDETSPATGARREQPADPFAEGILLEAGIAVLRDRLRIEGDRRRFRDLLTGWREELSEAVRAGDLARAEAWLRAVVTAPVYPAEMGDLVEEALDEVSVPAVLDQLAVHLVAAPVPGTGAGLVKAWGERMAGYLVRAMIVEHPPVSRRHLTEFLAWVGQEDIRLLAALRRDPHWFVLRNLAIALGRTGRLAAVPALESLLGHTDYRVRIETLRGLWTLKGEQSVPMLVAALSDPEPRVRHAACSLLRASPGREVVGAVAGVLESPGLAAAEASRLVGLIAERADPDVPTVLARLAECGRGGTAARAVRRAARRALAGEPPRAVGAGPGAPVIPT
ncbi:MAG TPA: HEAT repeat domain-containing protein [Polyangia bacterium]|nr:HEAT repeat domain-containing protein [Polyangia bacterium]